MPMKEFYEHVNATLDFCKNTKGFKPSMAVIILREAADHIERETGMRVVKEDLLIDKRGPREDDSIN